MIDQDGVRSVGPSDEQVNRAQSLLWPDVQSETIGAYSQAEFDSRSGTWRLALRVDQVSAAAEKSHVDPDPINPMMNPPAPDDLYQAYYGTDGSDSDETLWHGLIGWSLASDDQRHAINARVAHIMRNADATERYLASWFPGMMASRRWVGNPNLEPERHYQVALNARTGDEGCVYRLRRSRQRH